LHYADMRTARSNGSLPTPGSPNKSLAARVWELLDETDNVPDLASRVRAEAPLSTGGDSYAIERAVAGVIEQFIAAGRVRLVRHGVGGDASVHRGPPSWSEG